MSAPAHAGSARDRLLALSLLARFALTGSAVMIAAAVIIGIWVTGIIERSVISNTASATALFMDSFIAPLAQELESNDTLSIGPVRAIEESLSDSALGERVVSVKIWKSGGLVAYAENQDLIGKRFPGSDELQGAFAGKIVSELDDLDNEESAVERASGLSLLEIYSPIRKSWSGEVIAVAEFYEKAGELRKTLLRARVQTAGIVFVVTLLIAVALLGIVSRASKTIDNQRHALATRIDEAERIGEQNRRLRMRIEDSAARGSELNERFLRRISADLHDGPAQLISLAALGLQRLVHGRARKGRLAEMGAVKGALDEALAEIRGISHGLSLPDVDKGTLADAIDKAVTAHKRHTGTDVSVEVRDLPSVASEALKICVYRFVQEGLNNAFRHASGKRQSVTVSCNGETLGVSVTNSLPAKPAQDGRTAISGLGLAGLRERVESLGGRFSFRSAPAHNAILEMTIAVSAGERRDA